MTGSDECLRVANPGVKIFAWKCRPTLLYPTQRRAGEVVFHVLIVTGGAVRSEKFFASLFGRPCIQRECGGKNKRENPTNAFQQHIGVELIFSNFGRRPAPFGNFFNNYFGQRFVSAKV
jgi:hypothetical protein